MSVVYHPLEGLIELDAPTSWDVGLVQARLIEGCKVAAATERPRPDGLGNSWPPILRTWDDYLGRGTEARDDVLARWGRLPPSYDADTISRASEAILWPIRYLRCDEGCARVLMACCTAKAAHMKLVRVFRKRGWSMSTVKWKRRRALEAIAAGLNTDRVAIREAQVLID